jgi:hypothetical protein
MAKTNNTVTISEKTLKKLIKMCQTVLFMQDECTSQLQQQGYQINTLNKKIDLIEICIKKKKKQEH